MTDLSTFSPSAISLTARGERNSAASAVLVLLGLCLLIVPLSASAQQCGDPLGAPYRGVTPLSNAPYMGKGTACGGEGAQDQSPFGYRWQCVEFVRRFHATNNGPNVWNRGNAWPRVGSAYLYFENASRLGLGAIPNGDIRDPQPDDILVFGRASKMGDTFGHVGIVSSASADGVTIVEQNSSPVGYKFLPRDRTRSGYFLADRGSYPILGWLRRVDTAAGSTVVPRAQEAVEGNLGNSLPFYSASGFSTIRYQQVYAASEFEGLGPVLIKRIAFRPNAVDGSGSGVGQAFPPTQVDLQINLSTTSAAPDGLSLTFADNAGPDETVVVSGPIPLSSAFDGPLGGPKSFDVVIDLTTAFLYDPAKGNLLLDVRNLSTTTTSFIDMAYTAGDSVSRVSTSNLSRVDSPIADFGDTGGLITRLEWVRP